MSTGTTLSKWHIHSSNSPACIALVSNGTFIAASAHSSVSFWDTTTREQIGTVIEHTHSVESMAMSSNYDLVTSGEKIITLRPLCGVLPSHYLDNAIESQAALLAIGDPLLQEIQHTEVEKVEDNPSTFTCILIPVSMTSHPADERIAILRKPSRTCASSSPNLSNKPIRRGIASPSCYALKRRARVCPPLV